MRGAACVLALIGAASTAHAAVNNFVVATSVPEQIDSKSIRFENITHNDAVISWTKPGLGNWQWPISGYRIQISNRFSWVKVDGSTTPGVTTVQTYSPTILWDACPVGADYTKICKDGVLTSVTGTATSFSMKGLTANSSYYFKVQAFNHDGSAVYSGQSYELRTHAVPNVMKAPEVVSTTEKSVTIKFETPVTIGTSSCNDTSKKSLADETCHGYECSAVSTEACQTVGGGSVVTAYRVYQSTDGQNFTEIVDPITGLPLYPISPTSASGYTISNLKANTMYYYKTSAVNAVGESVISALVSGTTLDRPLKPFPPVALSLSDTMIKLTWNTIAGYCPSSNVPLPSPGYTTVLKPTKSRTTGCPYDNGVAVTGYRLFASSYNPVTGAANAFNSVTDDGQQWNQEYQQYTNKNNAKNKYNVSTAGAGDWEPARRGSLKSDASGTAYWSSPVTRPKPTDLPDAGKWLELVTPSTYNPATAAENMYTVNNLAQDTYYKFRIIFTNAVGDSVVSEDSEFFLTLEAPVSELKMHVGPPCIYEDGRATRFVATSSGTNVFYKWQLPDGMEYNSHDTRNKGSQIAEGKSANCKTSDCSIMEYVIPAVSTATGPSAQPNFTMAVIGYNTRGQVMLETTLDIEYCGCTDPWDPSYWDTATYHLPLMCGFEDWDGSDKTVIKNNFQYYEYYFKESTHDAQIIIRVDEGAVDLFTSATRVPDPAMSTTYQRYFPSISSFYVLNVPYSDLLGSRKLYIAIRGSSSAAFSRYSVLGNSQEFTRGRGLRHAGGSTVAGSQDFRRTQLLNIEPQAFTLKTPYYDFFEYYYAQAGNDVDVELKVNCQKGCVNVYTSKTERFSSAVRKTDAYSGYWNKHNGMVCAAVTDANKKSIKQATASFDGVGGIYGMVTFSQPTIKSSVLVSVSLKGLADTASDWKIHTGPAGAAGTGCVSVGAVYTPNGHGEGTDLSKKLGQLPGQAVGAMYVASHSNSDVTLYGEDISNTFKGIGRNGALPTNNQSNAKAQSIIGRSVVITNGVSKVCATIYPDMSVTSYVGELSLMHTIKPEEKRHLYASVQGSMAYNVGSKQEDNQYTIEAKIYRYRISSNLMVPSQATDGKDVEDRRYSVVSIDNFNYYEVEMSTAGYGLTIEFTLAYGNVQLFTNKDKLPSQDSIGYDNMYGNKDSSVGCVSGCTVKDATTGTWSPALAAGTAFEVGKTYRIDLPYSDINMKQKFVFVGVLGKAPDSSYSISVTEYVFKQPKVYDISDGKSAEVEITAQKYTFFQLYVGPKDQYMETTYRSHAGLRTSDLGSDPNTWGIDWYEPLATTWTEQQQDEWDLDVDVALDFDNTISSSSAVIYGSSHEMYPSEERGYAKRNQNCTRWQVMEGTHTCTVTSPFSIPHFTFSDKLVYFSVWSNTATTMKVTGTVKEMHLNTKSVDTPTVVPTCPGEKTVSNKKVVCSGRGSCFLKKGDSTRSCFCDNGFLGDACEIEAFSAVAGQPQLTIATAATFFPSGNSANAFPGNESVTVPFTLDSIPKGSKVHIYVDGLPYPAKGANVLYYATPAASMSEKIEIFTQLAGVKHTVELLLLSSTGIPLATDMRQFTVAFVGGCQDGCSKNGVCHHGYCVCFDGWAGVACEWRDKDEDGKTLPTTFSAGDGFVVYNTNLMKQERAEDAYLSKLKLDANKQYLATSDLKIKTEHAAVVTKLNTFRTTNDAKMAALKTKQDTEAAELFRKRDRITTTIQQMREESMRLKTRNDEAYYNTVRALHVGQRKLQNALDVKRRDHFIQMAKRHDEWVEIKARNDFKLNQLRTANGPLIKIPDLKEKECTQNDMFKTECHDVAASSKFVSQPGYMTYGTVKDVKGTTVTVNSEMKATMYDNIPR